ncbi:hypothetical protein Tco_0297819, partial [Tanacetum coccineum]
DKQVFGQKARDLDVESWKSRKVNLEADYGVIPTHRLRRNTLKPELSQQGILWRNTSSTVTAQQFKFRADMLSYSALRCNLATRLLLTQKLDDP